MTILYEVDVNGKTDTTLTSVQGQYVARAMSTSSLASLNLN